jgi:hypothetical protein
MRKLEFDMQDKTDMMQKYHKLKKPVANCTETEQKEAKINENEQ